LHAKSPTFRAAKLKGFTVLAAILGCRRVKTPRRLGNNNNTNNMHISIQP